MLRAGLCISEKEEQMGRFSCRRIGAKDCALTSVKRAHARIRRIAMRPLPNREADGEFTTNEKGSRNSGSLEVKRKLRLEGECSSQSDLARDLPEVRLAVFGVQHHSGGRCWDVIPCFSSLIEGCTVEGKQPIRGQEVIEPIRA